MKYVKRLEEKGFVQRYAGQKDAAAELYENLCMNAVNQSIGKSSVFPSQCLHQLGFHRSSHPTSWRLGVSDHARPQVRIEGDSEEAAEVDRKRYDCYGDVWTGCERNGFVLPE
jgi:hypothetical protein